jgi:glycosyltransferase involved in cell wall biosynthesis
VRILLWHVHGSWTTAFVQGPHTYLLPVLPDRGPDGRGRAQTWEWPTSAEELTPATARAADIDLVILQRPSELDGLVEQWTGRRPGTDIPAVYLEHNTPEGAINAMRHPTADRTDIPVAHVTYFNDLFWDCGKAPTVVIEHGIVDPGHRYSGTVPRAAAVINDPGPRARVTGTDVLERVRHDIPVDLFGMRTEPFGGADLTQAELHDAMSERRVYFHPNRWTSLGLSLIEAMHLGMPVVALATTEASEAVPSGAGVISNRMDVLVEALRRFIHEPDAARAAGDRGRQGALHRFGLGRFLDDWDRLIEEVTP